MGAARANRVTAPRPRSQDARSCDPPEAPCCQHRSCLTTTSAAPTRCSPLHRHRPCTTSPRKHTHNTHAKHDRNPKDTQLKSLAPSRCPQHARPQGPSNGGGSTWLGRPAGMGGRGGGEVEGRRGGVVRWVTRLVHVYASSPGSSCPRLPCRTRAAHAHARIVPLSSIAAMKVCACMGTMVTRLHGVPETHSNAPPQSTHPPVASIRSSAYSSQGTLRTSPQPDT